MTALAEVMVIIVRPGPAELVAIMRRAAAWVKKKVPRRLIPSTRSKSSTVASRMSPRTHITPALLTRQSSWPDMEYTCSSRTSCVARSARFCSTNIAFTPRLRAILSVSLASASCATSLMTMSKPASASAQTMPRPMPRRPPVTRATFRSAKFGSPRMRRAYSAAKSGVNRGRAALAKVDCSDSHHKSNVD